MSGLRGANVLVTGGAGFIGSHVVDRLLDETGAASVRVLDNFTNGSEANVRKWLGNPRFHLHKGDIRDASIREESLMKVDVVFHLACLGVRHSLHDPIENHSVNAEGTLLLLGSALKSGVRRFIHISSSEVYGSALYAPMDEDHPTRPETVYGGSKLAGEAYARAYFRTYGLPVVIARPFNTYGPRSHYEGDSGEVIPRTIVRLLNGERPIVFGDGEQTRDFMHVTDTARGLLALAECEAAIGRTVNFGSGVEISMNQLSSIIAHASGSPHLTPLNLAGRPGDVRRLLVDSSLMHSLTGFEPRVPFESGVGNLLAWFRDLGTSPSAMLQEVTELNWLEPVGGAR